MSTADAAAVAGWARAAAIIRPAVAPCEDAERPRRVDQLARLPCCLADLAHDGRDGDGNIPRPRLEDDLRAVAEAAIGPRSRGSSRSTARG